MSLCQSRRVFPQTGVVSTAQMDQISTSTSISGKRFIPEQEVEEGSHWQSWSQTGAGT